MPHGTTNHIHGMDALRLRSGVGIYNYLPLLQVYGGSVQVDVHLPQG